jgi:hypothetical protein
MIITGKVVLLAWLLRLCNKQMTCIFTRSSCIICSVDWCVWVIHTLMNLPHQLLITSKREGKCWGIHLSCSFLYNTYSRHYPKLCCPSSMGLTHPNNPPTMVMVLSWWLVLCYNYMSWFWLAPVAALFKYMWWMCDILTLFDDRHISWCHNYVLYTFRYMFLLCSACICLACGRGHAYCHKYLSDHYGRPTIGASMWITLTHGTGHN